jgi:peptide/nickel transport system ATP-binding protein
MTLVLITHNIGIVAELADRVAVMYAGKLVELADVLPLFEEPLHPYTEALLSSVPNIRLDTELRIMEGQPPDLLNPPPGCRFHPRCPHAMDICRKEEPPLVDLEGGRKVACWLYESGGVPHRASEGTYV